MKPTAIGHALAALFVSTAVPSLAAPVAYTLTELGTLGGTSSFALDVNNLGQVTGNAQLDASQPSPRLNAFQFSGNGPLANLGVLAGSNNFSRGYAINDAGVIVGESDNNSSRAFVYQNGTMTGLTRIAGDNDRGVAHDVNNQGVIVGSSSNGTASRPTQWVGSVASDLGSLDGTTTTSGRAWGNNDAGLAVGFSRTAGGTSQATLWNWAENGGAPYNLGSLTGQFSEAVAVNEGGWIVGTAVNGTTSSGTEIRQAVLWTPHDDHYHIGGLGSLGRTFSEAKDINDAGQVVGFATNISGSPQVAFLWEDGVMVDLNTFIDPASGVVLRTAEGINDHGQIVGYGTFGSATRAFLLTPVPEPGTWAFVLVGLAGVGAVAKRRRVNTVPASARQSV